MLATEEEKNWKGPKRKVKKKKNKNDLILRRNSVPVHPHPKCE